MKAKLPATQVLVIFVFGLLCTAASHASEATYRFLIPEGYLGYVQIRFNVKDTPPLPSEGDFRLVKVPPGGVLGTSSSMIETTKFPFQRREFFFYSPAGARKPMPPPSCGGGFTRQKTGSREIDMIFFVGTCSEYEILKTRLNAPGSNPVIGPQKITR